MAMLAVLGSLSVPVVVAFILSTAQVGGVDDISIAVGPLIARIVISQVLLFFLGMAVRARLGRAADRAHPVAMLISNISFLVILGWILLVGSGDVIRLAGPFLFAALALIVLAILLGALLAPRPAELRTTAGGSGRYPQRGSHARSDRRGVRR